MSTPDLLHKLAARGNAEAQYRLAVELMASDEPMARDLPAAVEWLRKAADAGHAPAMRDLGICYMNGKVVACNGSTAREWLELAADRNDTKSMMLLSGFFADGRSEVSVPKDLPRAFELMKRAADLNVPEAQQILGNFYYEGTGVLRDTKQAVTWWRRAAEQRHAPAQFELGEAYRRGECVPQDTKEAMRWFRRAAAQGHKMAKALLTSHGGTRYGEAPDAAIEAEATRAAAERGCAKEQCNLAGHYLSGKHGLPQDHALAAHWLSKSADQGHKEAIMPLAKLYMDGHGPVDLDTDEKRAWATTVLVACAASLGDGLAVKFLWNMRKGGDHDAFLLQSVREAATQGDAWAQCKLGEELLATGAAAEAGKFIAASARQGYADALALLNSDTVATERAIVTAVCAGCGKTEEQATKMYACKTCSIARFCSRACQKRAWKTSHKAACSAFVKAAAAE